MKAEKEMKANTTEKYKTQRKICTELDEKIAKAYKDNQKVFFGRITKRSREHIKNTNVKYKIGKFMKVENKIIERQISGTIRWRDVSFIEIGPKYLRMETTEDEEMEEKDHVKR